MDIHQQTPLVARKEIFIQAAPDVVWRLLADIDHWSQWQPGISQAKLEGPLAVGSAFRWKAGGFSITSVLQEVEPNQLLGWTGTSFGMRARHVMSLHAVANGTHVANEESLAGGPAKLVKILMPGYLERSMDVMLGTLKRKAEEIDGTI